jgi:hypothetical protein
MQTIEILSQDQQDAFEDRAYAAWMAKVDAILVRKTGLDSNDLPDICYRDMHDDGASPSEAAREAIRYADEG